ncbi:MAG TPA: regulator, partial [Leptospiraceae bacterium]|nr:regulator [Leptospiraceae bacterium]
MAEIIEKIQASRSLRVQIGILYSLLAMVNILFFSVMIFENQTELLVKNFNFQSVNFVSSVLEDVKEKPISRENTPEMKKFFDSMKFHEVEDYVIFDLKGTIVHKSEKSTRTVDPETLKKTKEISDQSSIFSKKYHL